MTLLRLPLAAALALLAAAVRSGAQDQPGNALMIFDSYLAQAAITNPAYRTDLKAGADASGTAPGRHTGASALIGPFTYRAKTFAELSRQERAQLLGDPAFRAFLIAGPSRRAGPDRPEPPPVPAATGFLVTAGEFLSPAAIRIAPLP